MTMTDMSSRARQPIVKLHPIDREDAAASAQNEVAILLDEAASASGMSQQEVADFLGVTAGRVSQVMNSEGNLQVTTLARYLAAMGFMIRIEADPSDARVPSLGRRFRRRRRRSSHQVPVDVHVRQFSTSTGVRVSQMLISTSPGSPSDRPDVPFGKVGSFDGATVDARFSQESVRLTVPSSSEIEQ